MNQHCYPIDLRTIGRKCVFDVRGMEAATIEAALMLGEWDGTAGKNATLRIYRSLDGLHIIGTDIESLTSAQRLVNIPDVKTMEYLICEVAIGEAQTTEAILEVRLGAVNLFAAGLAPPARSVSIAPGAVAPAVIQGHGGGL